MRKTDGRVTFVYLPSYERTAKGVVTDEVQLRLEELLSQDPEAGAVIRKTGGVRKVRVALPGRGKSGGARVIYYYRNTKGKVYLILAYPKNAKGDLTGREEAAMKQLVERLEAEPS